MARPPRFAPAAGYALCGHVHPGVRIEGAGESARLPCFVLGRKRAILPAFGRFTGLANIAPSHDERIVAIAGDALFELPAVSQNCNAGLPSVGLAIGRAGCGQDGG